MAGARNEPGTQRYYLALNRELGLKPWVPSPLPLAKTPLGVDQRPVPACATQDTA
jgi:hypothetical protein